MPSLNPRTKSKRLAAALPAICLLAVLSGVGFAADGAPAAPLRVTASTIDGKTIEGTLVAVSAEGVEIATGDAADSPHVKLSAAALTSVSVAGKQEPAERPVLAVSLVDGSLLAATAFRVHDGVATVVSASGEATAVATSRINWVRFRAPAGDDTFASEWNGEIVGQTSAEPMPRAADPGAKVAAAADVLVIRKKTALDYLEGVAGKVEDESVVFEVDHDPVTVKRAKVEGLIYYHAKKGELADAAAVVADRSGSRLEIVSAALAGDRLKLTTPAGQEICPAGGRPGAARLFVGQHPTTGRFGARELRIRLLFRRQGSVAERGRVLQAPSRLVVRSASAAGGGRNLRQGAVAARPDESRLSFAGQIQPPFGRRRHRRFGARRGGRAARDSWDGKMVWEESVRGTDLPGCWTFRFKGSNGSRSWPTSAAILTPATWSIFAMPR